MSSRNRRFAFGLVLVPAGLFVAGSMSVDYFDREGWRFFNDDTGSKLIEDLYRTSRKFNGLVLSISQSPEDFLNTKCANAIISNSFTKYILKLNKGHEQLAQFDFNDYKVTIPPYRADILHP